MTHPFKILALCVSCLFSLLAFGQPAPFVKLPPQDKDNSSRNTQNVLTDNRGTTWMGTQNGLYCFDGHRLVHFDKSTGLPFLQITEIYEDAEGWLWLYHGCNNTPGCETDLAFFHPFTNAVLTFKERFVNAYITAGQIHRIHHTGGHLYFEANNRHYAWNPEQGLHEISHQQLRSFYFQSRFIVPVAAFLVAALFIGFRWWVGGNRAKQETLESAVREATKNYQQNNSRLSQELKELKRLDQMKSRFFANVSHEFRTPLSLMIGPIDSMIESRQLGNQNHTLATLVRQNAQNLLKLVNELLDLNKLEAHKLILAEKNVGIYFLLQRILSAYESHAQRKRVQFEFNCHLDKYLQVRLDADKFEKILNNLLSNAFKFTPENGHIRVFFTDTGSHFQLKVHDNGEGILPEDLPHVFNRFYQSSRHGRKAGGTGIGLALSRELAKLMEGKLWVESEPGNGSTFYFRFPKKQVLGSSNVAFNVNQAEPTASFYHAISREVEVSEGRTVKGQENNNPSILVVEDSYSMRRYLQTMLQENFQVRVAENGKSAFALLNTNDLPDLIISDIMMPEMDGYQLLEKIKSSSAFRQVPVIMLTARVEMADKLKALRNGVDDYMLKPFEKEELLVRIENLLHHARNRKPSVEKVAFTRVATLAVAQSSFTQEDRYWLEKLEAEVLKRLKSFDFSVSELAQALVTNRWQLNTRIKALTGLTTQRYIQEVRLNRAKKLLENRAVESVKRVAYAVGMKDVKYFSRQFKKRFGKLPSTYL